MRCKNPAPVRGQNRKHTLNHTLQIVRPGDIQGIYSVFRSTALRWEQIKPDFPKRIRFSPGVTGWRRSDLDRFFGLISEDQQ